MSVNRIYQFMSCVINNILIKVEKKEDIIYYIQYIDRGIQLMIIY